MKSYFLLVLIVCILFFAATFADETTEKATKKSASKGKKKEKDWNKVNINELDKEWEQGDASEELEDEFEKNRRIQAQRQPKLDMNDGASIQRAYKQDPFAFSGSGGGQMVFVDLHEKQTNGKPWTKNDVDTLAKKFSTLLKSGSIPAMVYNIDTERMLVHIEKPWQVKDMLGFLAKQREVKQFTANSKTYTPKDWNAQFGGNDDDDYDDDL